MRIGAFLLLIWLVIGAIAAGQRNYYSDSHENCAHARDHRGDRSGGPAELRRREPEGLMCTCRSRASKELRCFRHRGASRHPSRMGRPAASRGSVHRLARSPLTTSLTAGHGPRPAAGGPAWLLHLAGGQRSGPPVSAVSGSGLSSRGLGRPGPDSPGPGSSRPAGPAGTVRTRVARSPTPAIRVPMAMPMIRYSAAVAILWESAASVRNGKITTITVIRPTIQPKKTIGRGVLSSSRCASSVATSAAAAARSTSVVVCASP